MTLHCSDVPRPNAELTVTVWSESTNALVGDKLIGKLGVTFDSLADHKCDSFCLQLCVLDTLLEIAGMRLSYQCLMRVGKLVCECVSV